MAHTSRWLADCVDISTHATCLSTQPVGTRYNRIDGIPSEGVKQLEADAARTTLRVISARCGPTSTLYRVHITW